MILQSESLKNGERISDEYVFAVWAGASNKVKLAKNQNPHLSWSDFPKETKSFAVICMDPDVPSRPDDVNQEGKTVSKDLARVDFFHWALIDIPADIHEINVGEFSSGITAKGKAGPDTKNGMRHGMNNYTQWFEGDADMQGHYYGYDGPCPPWNDEIVHRYYFRVYALSCERFPIEGEFSAQEVAEKIAPLVIDQVEIMSLYAINPEAKIING